MREDDGRAVGVAGVLAPDASPGAMRPGRGWEGGGRFLTPPRRIRRTEPTHRTSKVSRRLRPGLASTLRCPHPPPRPGDWTGGPRESGVGPAVRASLRFSGRSFLGRRSRVRTPDLRPFQVLLKLGRNFLPASRGHVGPRSGCVPRPVASGSSPGASFEFPDPIRISFQTTLYSDWLSYCANWV